jgi:hypothetical protein
MFGRLPIGPARPRLLARLPHPAEVVSRLLCLLTDVAPETAAPLPRCVLVPVRSDWGSRREAPTRVGSTRRIPCAAWPTERGSR